MLASAFLTGAVFILGVAAWHLRKGHDHEAFSKAARVAVVVTLITAVGTILLGDNQAKQMETQQPMKMAAAEALYNTQSGASFSLLTIGDLSGNPVFQIRVPHILSVLATNTWDGKVKGINQLQKQAAAKYGKGSYVPVIWVLYWSFRIMVGLGILLLLLGGGGPVADAQAAPGEVAALPALRDLDDPRAVPRQHDRVDLHRGRTPAVGRLRAAQDLDGGVGHRAGVRRDQPDRLHRDLHLPRHRRDRPHDPHRQGPARHARPRPRPSACPSSSTRRRSCLHSLTASPSGLDQLWFTLIGVLWVGYFFLEGFDFGVGVLLPFVSKDDLDRRVVINTIGPVWDGNEVWLLTAGGATFAAFPLWYATVFSGFYLALFLVLAALIFRGMAFELRHRREDAAWARWWDRAIFWGSALPALLWGVAFADFVHGVPITAGGVWTGNFFELVKPYALVGGLSTLSLFTLHGATYLGLKSEGDVRERAQRVAQRLAPVTFVIVTAFLGWTYLSAHSMHHVGLVPPVLPLLGRGGPGGGRLAGARAPEGWAFVATAIVIVAFFTTLLLNLYPNVLGLGDPPGGQPDHRRERVAPLHARGHELGRPHLHALRPAVSELDLLDLPQAGRSPRRAPRRAAHQFDRVSREQGRGSVGPARDG